MYSNITDFVNDVSDSIRGNWSRVSYALQSRYSVLSPSAMSELSGDMEALRQRLVQLGLVKEDSVDNFIRKLAHKADHFNADPETLRAMRQNWSGLTVEDLGLISGRRSRLVSVLTLRYALTRQHAWQQVNSFFTRREKFS